MGGPEVVQVHRLEAHFLFVYSIVVNIRNDCRSVICQLQSTDKTQAILEVIDSCNIFSSLPDLERFKRGVLRRERAQTTGIGHGVAIAHGKILGLNEVHIALGISRDGIEYGSADGMPVHLLFVIASSPSIQMEYLGSLSAILRSVRTEEMRTHLMDIHQSKSDEACQRFFSMMALQRFIWFCKDTQ
ncbi:putative PTS IIA-like nitrogen-regulatory protein PtsN [Sphaerochaeta globosa str. Buddy]|uniref:Putative PTS IIA-like nitrogen-regulatory protein PtsN n=1 Tax=Sphaerochaeta globosa (strain ATCC BAA-1886 / DSM 22777 / Buddy) TaxID=158189 RepID=F0RT16_SPHGB|nr:putative PTS IIA-like nitrogen-regulatory protein PtsN [Sphaerochaeta globosa str. Buddy]